MAGIKLGPGKWRLDNDKIITLYFVDYRGYWYGLVDGVAYFIDGNANQLYEYTPGRLASAIRGPVEEEVQVEPAMQSMVASKAAGALLF